MTEAEVVAADSDRRPADPGDPDGVQTDMHLVRDGREIGVELGETLLDV